MKNSLEKVTFWDHLEELRDILIRITIVTVLCSIGAFVFKDLLFEIIFAPKNSDFVTYIWLEKFGKIFSETVNDEGFSVSLINTGLAKQFLVHMKTAFCFGLLCASPFIIYQLFMFVSPALYDNERKYSLQVIGSGYLMFIIGVLIGYLLIFPLTFRFLGTYQVSAEVTNMISLDSYMSTLLLICLAMGVVFELPVISWLLAKLGVLSSKFMKVYRKHAIVVILIIAAVITPTSDVFTLLAVSFPIWLLYEGSIFIVAVTEKKRKDNEASELVPV